MKNLDYLKDFMRRHNIRVKQEIELTFSKVFILEKGVFGNEDESSQFVIELFADGNIRYLCGNKNDCIDIEWSVVENLLEPNRFDLDVDDNGLGIHPNLYEIRSDLEDFLKERDIKIVKTVKIAGLTRFLLDHCVFNKEHKYPDVFIELWDNGAISYKCFHSSCFGYTWEDVRNIPKYDPYTGEKTQF